jgi:multimeric flavodoxin WrbA
MAGKIVILKGSPRVNGNSAVLADQAAKGAREAGAHVESFILHNMDISPCDACDTCLETGGVCVIKDDMQGLYPKLREADAILIASPIYWFTFSAQLKVCIDRWYAMQIPGGHELSGKDIGIVIAYGDTDPYNSGAVNAIYTFESMFRYIEANIVGMVYGTANDIGDAAKQPDLMEKAYQLGQTLAGECNF